MINTGFQTQVGAAPAPAVAGDFASMNPYYSVDVGAGGFVAGAAGCIVGRFAWANPGAEDSDGFPSTVTNTGAGAPTGFVHRHQQGLLTTYLVGASMTIPAGFQMALMKGGDFWVKNDGLAAAVPGMKAFVNFADGTAYFAAAGATPTGAAVVTASVAASTGSFTGSIAGDVLTITAVGSGVARPGGTLSGSGVVSGTTITAQLSGTAGGIGTYRVSVPQTVASTTISETYGTMTVSAVTSGTIGLGTVLSGTGVDAGTSVTQFITGAGGTGTYAVSSNTVVGSTTVTAAGGIETKWTCFSQGAPGELVKIGHVPNG